MRELEKKRAQKEQERDKWYQERKQEEDERRERERAARLKRQAEFEANQGRSNDLDERVQGKFFKGSFLGSKMASFFGDGVGGLPCTRLHGCIQKSLFYHGAKRLVPILLAGTVFRTCMTPNSQRVSV